MEAVATILSAVKVITSSVRSLTSIPQDNAHANTESSRGLGLGIHKWILIAGAVVGVITIAYLENIASNSKPKRTVGGQKQHERVETVYVRE
ncbi:MAG: hypothetical protein ACE5KA_00245 [Nitrososphaerales archaeon]